MWHFRVLGRRLRAERNGRAGWSRFALRFQVIRGPPNARAVQSSLTNMVSLTSVTWSGLPVHRLQTARRLHLALCELRSPVLVLWTAGEAMVDVRLNARKY